MAEFRFLKENLKWLLDEPITLEEFIEYYRKSVFDLPAFICLEAKHYSPSEPSKYVIESLLMRVEAVQEQRRVNLLDSSNRIISFVLHCPVKWGLEIHQSLWGRKTLCDIVSKNKKPEFLFGGDSLKKYLKQSKLQFNPPISDPLRFTGAVSQRYLRGQFITNGTLEKKVSFIPADFPLRILVATGFSADNNEHEWNKALHTLHTFNLDFANNSAINRNAVPVDVFEFPGSEGADGLEKQQQQPGHQNQQQASQQLDTRRELVELEASKSATSQSNATGTTVQHNSSRQLQDVGDRQNQLKLKNIQLNRDVFDSSERMAQIKGNIKELVTCPICFENIIEPKFLPCNHSFCLQCLKKLHLANSSGNTMNCPSCRRTCDVPSGNIDCLPANHVLNGVLNLYKLTDVDKEFQNESDTTLICSHCSIVNSNQPAEAYCIDCDEHLCIMCHKIHKSARASMNHNTFTSTPETTDQQPMKLKNLRCSMHPRESIVHYCSTCRITICRLCSMVAHTNHILWDMEITLNADFKNSKIAFKTNNDWENLLDRTLNMKTIIKCPLDYNVAGIVCGENEVYIMFKEAPSLRIFNMKGPSRNSVIVVSHLTSAVGLLFSLEQVCLYTASYNKNVTCLHRISTLDKSVHCWSLIDNHIPSQLSFSTSGNILICYEDCPQIDEYNYTGSFLKRIELKERFGCLDCVQLSNNTLLISRISKKGRIISATETGNIIKYADILIDEFYNYERRKSVASLQKESVVSRMLVDSHDNTLMIDLENCTIKVVDPRLTPLGDLNIAGRFCFLLGACYDEFNDRVLIATDSGVFELTFKF